jgi:hypothetical protein
VASRPSTTLNRQRSLAILVLVIAGGLVGVLALRPHEEGLGGGSACDQATKARQRIEGIKQGHAIPTATDYIETARAVRRAALTAPDDLAPAMHAVADAYGSLSKYYAGFDPSDESTYGIVEERGAEIERQQANVDVAEADIATWIKRTCS